MFSYLLTVSFNILPPQLLKLLVQIKNQKLSSAESRCEMFGQVCSFLYILYTEIILNKAGQYDGECVKYLMLCRPGLQLFCGFFLRSIWSLEK